MGEYQELNTKNKEKFAEFLRAVNPNLFMIYEILEKTAVNYFVIVKIIRALENVAGGSRYGTVTVNIENGKAMFVRGEQSDRINEEVIIKNEL